MSAFGIAKDTNEIVRRYTMKQKKECETKHARVAKKVVIYDD